MASTINPSAILDGLNVSETAVRTQFTNAASDVNNLQAPTYITVSSSGTLSNYRTLAGTTNQITTSDGGATGAFTLSISNNAVLPGTGSVTVPIGTVAQRPGSPVNGMVRYNSDNSVLEGYVNSSWVSIVTGTYVSSLNSLTGALSIATGTSGTNFAVSAAGSTVTLNLPDASATARGAITTGTQTIAGAKTFSSDLSVTSTGAVLVSSGSVAQRPGSPTNGMIRYNSDNSVLEGYVNSSWVTISTGGASGVSSLNSLTGALSIATGTSGTDFNVSASGSTVTLNIPSASASNRGLVTTGSQAFAGNKTFNNTLIASTVLEIDENVTYQGWEVDTPTTGQTVSVSSTNTYAIISPSGTLSSLTVQLPTAVYGQVIYICFQKAVTTLTISGQAGQTFAQTPTTAAAGQCFGFLYNSSSTIWYRIL